MSRHPRERLGLDRREFLQRSAAAGLGLTGAGALLAACASDEPTGAPVATGGGEDTTTAPFELARKDNPVTLPLHDDNPAIASGLSPEAGPLKIYNWIDYLDKATVKKFAKQFGVKTEITVFNTMDEAIAKLQAGTDFDVFFPLQTGSESSSPPSCCNRSTSTTCRTSRTCGRSSKARSTTSTRATRFRT